MRFNTIYKPTRWAFRILQENARADFTPSRNVRVEDNVIAFDGGRWFEGGVNVGAKTAPRTFTFARNVWYCADAPARSKPTLPTEEVDGVVGNDPRFKDEAKRDFTPDATGPAGGRGHSALR